MLSEERSPRLRALMEVIRLEAIHFREVTARQQHIPSPEPGTFELEINRTGRDVNDDSRLRLSVLLRVKVETDRGMAMVEPFAVYSIPEAESHLAEPGPIREFIEAVAVMTLLPYAREGLSTISAKVLTEHILMPAFTPEQLDLEISDPTPLSSQDADE